MLIFTNPLYAFHGQELSNFFDASAPFWLNDWVSAYSAVVHSNGKIYVTTNLNSLYELDPDSRSYRRVSQSIWAFCRLVSFENQLLCFGHRLTVIDTATGGSAVWMQGDGFLDSYWSRTRAAVVHLGEIYVATQSNRLYCIGSDRKATLVSSKHNWSTCSALVSLDGKLYATLGSTLVTLDVSTDTTHPIAEADSPFQCGALGSDNTLYLVSRNGSLFKLDVSTQKLISVLQKTCLGVASTIA
ncbi:hypothetical protein Unana1_08695 [Umbelopsis nana]